MLLQKGEWFITAASSIGVVNGIHRITGKRYVRLVVVNGKLKRPARAAGLHKAQDVTPITEEVARDLIQLFKE